MSEKRARDQPPSLESPQRKQPYVDPLSLLSILDVNAPTTTYPPLRKSDIQENKELIQLKNQHGIQALSMWTHPEQTVLITKAVLISPDNTQVQEVEFLYQRMTYRASFVHLVGAIHGTGVQKMQPSGHFEPTTPTPTPTPTTHTLFCSNPLSLSISFSKSLYLIDNKTRPILRGMDGIDGMNKNMFARIESTFKTCRWTPPCNGTIPRDPLGFATGSTGFGCGSEPLSNTKLDGLHEKTQEQEQEQERPSGTVSERKTRRYGLDDDGRTTLSERCLTISDLDTSSHWDATDTTDTTTEERTSISEAARAFFCDF